ncbi:hypothetical protein Taro_043903 [Colocasia esculenta]|uniref:Uncharacterized protein n=1 Tax=Colocasia esculenta TaxID=4460 RepID=A0A843WMA6_COLES|nr:hypothetical protein [Colocasia esculenta]
MIRQDFRGLVLEIREGVEPQILGTTSFRPMKSDRAQPTAVRYFLFNAVRENDTAGLPGLGSRNP